MRHSDVVKKHRGVQDLGTEAVHSWGHQSDQGGGSLERSLDPLQFFLDLTTLPLAGLLEASVGHRELLVRGGQPGDATPEVVLQLSVRAVRVCDTLEGMDLTHDFGNAPESMTDKT